MRHPIPIRARWGPLLRELECMQPSRSHRRVCILPFVQYQDRIVRAPKRHPINFYAVFCTTRRDSRLERPRASVSRGLTKEAIGPSRARREFSSFIPTSSSFPPGCSFSQPDSRIVFASSSEPRPAVLDRFVFILHAHTRTRSLFSI